MNKVKNIKEEISENINTRKHIFKFLLFSSISLFIIYIYLVGSITFNIISRRSLLNNIIVLNSQLNELESSYLNKINNIDKEYAYSKGFIDIKQNLFITRSLNHIAVR